MAESGRAPAASGELMSDRYGEAERRRTIMIPVARRSKPTASRGIATKPENGRPWALPLTACSSARMPPGPPSAEPTPEQSFTSGSHSSSTPYCRSAALSVSETAETARAAPEVQAKTPASNASATARRDRSGVPEGRGAAMARDLTLSSSRALISGLVLRKRSARESRSWASWGRFCSFILLLYTNEAGNSL